MPRCCQSATTRTEPGTYSRCRITRYQPFGSLYDGSYRAALGPRACPLAVCDCHIGYVHLETLPLYDVFAGGVLERVPRTLPDRPLLPLVPSELASTTAAVTGSPRS